MTNIHFIDHSGFLIELEEVFLVFDFFQDPAQVLSRFSKSEKPFVFFVSHSHQDHWNQEILNFKTNARSTTSSTAAVIARKCAKPLLKINVSSFSSNLVTCFKVSCTAYLPCSGFTSSAPQTKALPSS